MRDLCTKTKTTFGHVATPNFLFAHNTKVTSVLWAETKVATFVFAHNTKVTFIFAHNTKVG